jgi:diaminopimelate decarboxylase
MNTISAAEPSLTLSSYKTSFGEFIGIGDNGNLWVEGCDVADLVKRFGTPLFIISESQLRHNYRQFRDAFRQHHPDVEILFANKSNSGLAIRHIMNQEGAGGDCFGVNEVYPALLAGTDPATLVLNGSNKQTEELEMAIQNGLCINIGLSRRRWIHGILCGVVQCAASAGVGPGVGKPCRNHHS